MQIHECARCEGCGYVTGWTRWEVAWSRWAAAGGDDAGVLAAAPCPDCGGTGALIEQTASEPAGPGFASRRGLTMRDGYARHVSRVLHEQTRRARD